MGDGGGANKNIYALDGEDADIDITLSGPVQAFGLGIFSNDRHTTAERIIFFAPDNSIVANVEMPLTSFQGTMFIGFLADAPLVSRVAFVEDADGAVLRAQLAHAAERIRTRLASILARDGDSEPPEALIAWLCARPAEVIADPGWIEVHLPVDSIDTCVRRAGLDVDPNYVAWLGVVVRFYYA